MSSLGVVVRLQRLGKLLGRRANRALKAHELKLWEYDVLSALRRQGPPAELPASELARYAQLTSGAMTTRIDGLEQRGLVRRRQSKADGRSVLVSLTAAGRRLIDAAIDTRLDDAERALEVLPKPQRHQLQDMLGELLAALERTQAAR